MNFNWLGQTEMPMIHQATSTECGLACVTMLAIYHGHDISMASMRRKHEIPMLGASLADLADIAATLDLTSSGVSCEVEELQSLKLPAILHWNFNHFVVLKSVKNNRFEIYDPAKGKRYLNKTTIGQHFTGVALEVQKAANFAVKKEKVSLPITSLIDFDKPSWGAIGKILALSLFLQSFILVAPLFMQLVIDEAILKNDVSILIAIAFGFLGLKLFELFVAVARQILLQVFGQNLSFKLRSNIFHHLVRLPVSYFQQRESGDILNRAHSGDVIGDFIAKNLTEAIIDGIFAISIAFVIFSYNAYLGAVVLGFIVLYSVTRLAFLRKTHQTQAEDEIVSSKEASYFLETLRIMPTLKMFGGEVKREFKWRNLASNSVNKAIQVGNFEIGYANLSQGIIGISNIVIVFIAANAVINNTMTVGMITAFMAYKIQFEQKLMSLLDKSIEYKLMDVHLDRLSDIALSEKEEVVSSLEVKETFKGSIEFKDVHFRYSSLQEDILKGVSFKVSPQEFIALAGRSGQGKSTLLKLVMGVYQPTSGQILYDGKPISYWGTTQLRRQISIVMQDDELLAGTIRENICFFDDAPDEKRLVWASHVACILGDIEAMPMGMDTIIGEMGDVLSGGQRQRVMLARALYKKPKLLILDEGTSHLDLKTESLINDELQKLDITRIFAAHRPDTLQKANRILTIQDGKIFSECLNNNDSADIAASTYEASMAS